MPIETKQPDGSVKTAMVGPIRVFNYVVDNMLSINYKISKTEARLIRYELYYECLDNNPPVEARLIGATVYRGHAHNPHKDMYTLYIKKKIKQYFGLSITEFLELPVHKSRLLLEIADEEIEKDSKYADQLALNNEDIMEELGLDTGI